MVRLFTICESNHSNKCETTIRHCVGLPVMGAHNNVMCARQVAHYPSFDVPKLSSLFFDITAAQQLSLGSNRDLMATPTFSLEDAINAIAEDGFFHIQDPLVGQGILDMERNKHQFSTKSQAGLQFYRDNVLGSEVSRPQQRLHIHRRILIFPAHPASPGEVFRMVCSGRLSEDSGGPRAQLPAQEGWCKSRRPRRAVMEGWLPRDLLARFPQGTP